MPPRESDSVGVGTLRSRTATRTTSTVSSAEEKAKSEISAKSQRIESKAIATPTWSANVVFYPPSLKYWRIGSKWYDLSKFNHPGGQQIMNLARDRFEDATFAFEAHHHNYEKARKVLRKYMVEDQEQAEAMALRRPMRHEKVSEQQSERPLPLPLKTHHDKLLDDHKHPQLLDHDAFYSVLRRRVADYLKSVNCKDGEPTWECIGIFWTVLSLWVGLSIYMYTTGSYVVAIPTAFMGAVLGSFGHNWIHQPRYKHWGWALLSLDSVGFSSEGWYRDHVLVHHMYTNTPWDQHFLGSDPFIKTDPTAKRHWIQEHVTPHLFHLVLSFGTYGNYINHTKRLFRGEEEFSIGKPWFVIQHLLFYQKWGLHGLLLVFFMHAVLGNYYFTMALMNHNAEHCLDTKRRNNARDWGEAQLISCADWSVHLSFRQSMVFLWLNFHTVHHLFPKIDQSHHASIHGILTQTCEEYDVDYQYSSPVTIYKQMIHSFGTPMSLMQEFTVYAGGI